MPLGVSYWVWRGLYVVISALLLRRAGLDWPVIVLGLAGPATLLDIFGGENGVLTGGVLVSALLMMNTKPFQGGVIAGLLCIKPQVGMMLPMVLFGRRPALAGFVLCVGLLVLATLPLEGWYSWWWFLSGSRQSSTSLVVTPFTQLFPVIGDTTFYMARSFGAGLRQAWMIQAISSVLAAAVTLQVWRRARRDPVLLMAMTVCLTVLLVPYGYLYDLVGYCVAMAALFFRAPDMRKPVYMALWLFAGALDH